MEGIIIVINPKVELDKIVIVMNRNYIFKAPINKTSNINPNRNKIHTEKTEHIKL
jgi:hypothetical protein